MRVRYERYQGARISAKSHKEGPACGRIPCGQSHKEGPTLVGGSLVGGASGMKDIRLTGSAQNVKRQKNIYRDER